MSTEQPVVAPLAQGNCVPSACRFQPHQSRMYDPCVWDVKCEPTWPVSMKVTKRGSTGVWLISLFAPTVQLGAAQVMSNWLACARR